MNTQEVSKLIELIERIIKLQNQRMDEVVKTVKNIEKRVSDLEVNIISEDVVDRIADLEETTAILKHITNELADEVFYEEDYEDGEDFDEDEDPCCEECLGCPAEGGDGCPHDEEDSDYDKITKEFEDTLNAIVIALMQSIL